MGQKRKDVSDPKLAKAIPAGTTVRRIQHSEHAQFGSITYEVRTLWVIHWQLAQVGFHYLSNVHNQVLHLPVTPNADRFLSSDDNPDLAVSAYCAGTQMILNVVLTMQHFCYELEATLGAQQNGSTIEQRLKEALSTANIPFEGTSKGYAALREIIERRDGLEHPKRETVHNSHVTDWDKVPLGWFLSERALNAYKNWLEWFKTIVDQWEAHKQGNTQILTLQVQRGIKSTRPFKKPPKQNS